MNQLVLTGRLTSDTELQTTSSGINFVKTTIAVDREFKDAKGEKVTDFFDITVWRQSAEYISKYAGKGDLVGVVGQLQKRSYERDGKNIWTTDVVVDKIQVLHRKEQEVKQDIVKHDTVKQEAVKQDTRPLATDDELPF
jgi:single-strand DNA-binding protein